MGCGLARYMGVGAGSEPARTKSARTWPARTEPAHTEHAHTGGLLLMPTS